MYSMDGLDSLRDKAVEAAQFAARKTKKLAEIAKTNLAIHAEKDKIKKAQLELGKLYYRDHCQAGSRNEEEYLPWCKKIDECRQTIRDLRVYMEELRTEKVIMEAENTTAVPEEDTVQE